MSFSAATLKRSLLTAAPRLRAPVSTAARPSPFSVTRVQPSIRSTRLFQSSASRMGVHNLANKTEWDSALQEPELVVLDCFATWCGPCKVIAPQLVKFSEAFPNAKFYKLDVDEVPDVAQELGIRAMPTFLLFKGGEKVGEVVGANPKALETAIRQHLGEL
ncbi:thioredoxin [Diplodia corticola]|uniref:Thioredoxin n=1 Tax=Diplodia corticola TaxID=236234 RepID=A0A1J9RG75_9PEZI|nr:thioredoxin [Diplodia corticola]OJD40534.1 thioredoxin [Diplodia corticola]